jgi:biotin synthase-like enzyme
MLLLKIFFVHKNIKNGLGYYINRNFINVFSVAIFDGVNWKDLLIEDLTALAFKIEDKRLKSYKELLPRTLSFLPISNACQAKCWFCFSNSSISTEIEQSKVDFILLDKACVVSKERGAERFVITGGGDPGLLNFDLLIKVISLSRNYFKKAVLITNGMFLSKLSYN